MALRIHGGARHVHRGNCLEVQEVQNLEFAPRKPRGPTGLGGWLVLPIIGLCLTLLIASAGMAKDTVPGFFDGTWSNLTTPGSAGYHASWMPYLVLTFAAQVLLALGSLALLVLLFSRKSVLPVAMIVFYLACIAFAGIDLWAVTTFLPEIAPEAAKEMGPSILKDFARAIVSSLIWIPYFMNSERVRNTFVN